MLSRQSTNALENLNYIYYFLPDMNIKKISLDKQRSIKIYEHILSLKGIQFCYFFIKSTKKKLNITFKSNRNTAL